MGEPGRAAEPPSQPPAVSAGEPRTRGFLFCDLRDYTAFVEAHGDRAGAALLERYRALVRAAAGRSAGAEIRTEGDSFYVVFPAASLAVSCGLDIVAGAAEATAEAPDQPIPVGVGIHAGESVEQAEGYVGSAVNIAARVCAEARAGEVLVTDTVRSLVRTSLDVSFTARGSRRLKGIAEAIALYRVTGRAPVAARTIPRTRARSPAGGVLVLGAILLVVVAAFIARPWATGGAPPASSSPVPSGGQSAAPSGDAALTGQLAFIATQVIGADPEPRWQLYVAPAGGGDWKRMTELTDRVSLAAWSPDGRQLVYNLRSDENLPPRVVTVATAPAWTQRPWPSTTDVVEWQGDVYALESIDWSPTDELITEGSPGERAGPSRIFAVPPDGSAVRLVTEPDPAIQPVRVGDHVPSVSPDGRTIVFASGVSDIALTVWAAGADGTGRIQVTDEIYPEVSFATQAATGPAWSPDGSRLAISASSPSGGSADIYTVNARGTDVRRITDDGAGHQRPAWSPDGRWIAWTQVVAGQRQIWVMASDGTQARPLIVGSEGDDLDLVGWAPDPEAP